MKLVMYKGPAKSLRHKIAHWAIRIWTRSEYSHCELWVDGICYSSSPRDHGVRGKIINIYSGHWDVFDIAGDSEYAKKWFHDRFGRKYDWAGVGRFVLPWLPNVKDRWFCSEAVAQALQLNRSAEYSPERLFRELVKE